jgi:hypothetical protein
MPVTDTEVGTRQAIYDTVQDFAGTIGRWHMTERAPMSVLRFPDDDEANPIQGWTLEIGDPDGKMAQVNRMLDTRRWLAVRTWTIRGFWQISEEANSFAACLAAAKQIMYTLIEHRSLGGAPGFVTDGLVNLITFDKALYQSIDLHYVELVFQTQSEEGVAEWL